MPELPEVHTISSDLNSVINGFTITNALASESYNIIPDKNIFIKNIIGTTIGKVYRIAKNILIELNSKDTILFHLAMTGQILIKEESIIKPKWVKFALELQKNNIKKTLAFGDMRTFGKVLLLNSKEISELSKKYGPEPIDKNLSANEFLKLIKSKRTNIKNVLLEQKIISGLGNIYATDALYLAKINPHTPTSKINLKMAEKLLNASKNILLEGIKNRGSTLPDKMYVDIFGKPGNQQNYFKIYMKNTCPICKNKVIFTKINGRGTYFCPTCQPKN